MFDIKIDHPGPKEARTIFNSDKRSNLCLFFIYKCILHLEDGGELISYATRFYQGNLLEN